MLSRVQGKCRGDGVIGEGCRRAGVHVFSASRAMLYPYSAAKGGLGGMRGGGVMDHISIICMLCSMRECRCRLLCEGCGTSAWESAYKSLLRDGNLFAKRLSIHYHAQWGIQTSNRAPHHAKSPSPSLFL